MKKIVAAKEPARGVFWVIDGNLLAFPFYEEKTIAEGVAKTGNTYNHEKLWPFIRPKGCNEKFDYYPRGRVEFTPKGKPVIYMNPNIEENMISRIKVAFGLREDPIVRYDGSNHYKCYLDR